MDKSKIALVGSLVIVAIVLVGALVLTAKGIALPGWLAGLVTVVGMAVATFIKPPGATGDDK